LFYTKTNKLLKAQNLYSNKIETQKSVNHWQHNQPNEIKNSEIRELSQWDITL
jgi:hypothetical protein